MIKERRKYLEKKRYFCCSADIIRIGHLGAEEFILDSSNISAEIFLLLIKQGTNLQLHLSSYIAYI